MSELDALLKEFEQTADHMQSLVGELRTMFSAKEEPENEEPGKEISFTDLRALCAAKSRDGFTKNVRELIQAFGAVKLSEVEPSHYAELYKEVEGLK